MVLADLLGHAASSPGVPAAAVPRVRPHRPLRRPDRPVPRLRRRGDPLRVLHHAQLRPDAARRGDRGRAAGRRVLVAGLLADPCAAVQVRDGRRVRLPVRRRLERPALRDHPVHQSQHPPGDGRARRTPGQLLQRRAPGRAGRSSARLAADRRPVLLRAALLRQQSQARLIPAEAVRTRPRTDAPSRTPKGRHPR